MTVDRLSNHGAWLALLAAGRMRRGLGHPGMLDAAMLAHRRALGLPDEVDVRAETAALIADRRHVDDLHAACLVEYRAIAAATEREK